MLGRPYRSPARNALHAQARLFRGIVERIKMDLLLPVLTDDDDIQEEITPQDEKAWPERSPLRGPMTSLYASPELERITQTVAITTNNAVSVAQFISEMDLSLDLDFGFMDSRFMEAMLLLLDTTPPPETA